jgi:hypothetical protein
MGRWLRGGALLMAAMSMVTLPVGACSRVVTGTLVPAGSAGLRAQAPVAELLVEPDRFPAQYSAAVLDNSAVYRARRDVEGVAAGSLATPSDCSPPELGQHDSAAAEGIDGATASSLIVLVTRPAPPLRERAEQLRGCPSFTARHSETTSTVSAIVLPSPPVDADDSFAVDQVVTTAVTARRTLTLAAQIGDTRVSATWMQNPATDDPDTASLDAVFRDAVLKLRRAG